jgi:hypothetical protein
MNDVLKHLCNFKFVFLPNREICGLIKSQLLEISEYNMLPYFVSFENFAEDLWMLKGLINHNTESVQLKSSIHNKIIFLNSLETHSFRNYGKTYKEMKELKAMELIDQHHKEISGNKDTVVILPTKSNSRVTEHCRNLFKKALILNTSNNTHCSVSKVFECNNLYDEALFISQKILASRDKKIRIFCNHPTLKKFIISNLLHSNLQIKESVNLNMLPIYELLELILAYILEKSETNIWPIIFHPLCKFNYKRMGASPFKKSGSDTLAPHSQLMNILNYKYRNNHLKHACIVLQKILNYSACEFVARNIMSQFISELTTFSKYLKLNRYSAPNFVHILRFLADSYSIQYEGNQKNIEFQNLLNLDFLAQTDKCIYSDTGAISNYDLDNETHSVHTHYFRKLLSLEGAEYSYCANISDKKNAHTPAFSIAKIDTQVINVVHNKNDGKDHNSPQFSFPKTLFPNELSVSAIEKLIRCPYVFALEYILHIRHREKIYEENFTLDFGNYVHNALYKIDFTRPKVEVLNALQDTFHFDIPNHFSNIQKFAIHEKISDWSTFILKHDFCSLSLDKKEVKLSKYFDELGVTITARADRIIRQSNSNAIIDFKTGSPPTSKDLEKGLYPQLPIEKLLFGEDDADIIIFRFSFNSCERRIYKSCNDYVKANLVSLILQYIESGCFEGNIDYSDDQRVESYKHLIIS